MSHETVVYGAIVGATWRPPDYRRLQTANLSVLDSLPDHDEFPAICKSMFSAPPLHSCATFREQLIHFGGSFRGLDFDQVPLWIEKFESLLRRLYWFEATAHVWTDFIDGAYQFWWKASDESLRTYYAGFPEPTSAWLKKDLHLVRSLNGPPCEPFETSAEPGAPADGGA